MNVIARLRELEAAWRVQHNEAVSQRIADMKAGRVVIPPYVDTGREIAGPVVSVWRTCLKDLLLLIQELEGVP